MIVATKNAKNTRMMTHDSFAFFVFFAAKWLPENLRGTARRHAVGSDTEGRAAMTTAPLIAPLDEYNLATPAQRPSRAVREPDAVGAIQSGGHRRGDGGAGHGRGGGWSRREGRADRAAPDGRRLSQRRLRAVEERDPRRACRARGAQTRRSSASTSRRACASTSAQ